MCVLDVESGQTPAFSPSLLDGQILCRDLESYVKERTVTLRNPSSLEKLDIEKEVLARERVPALH